MQSQIEQEYEDDGEHLSQLENKLRHIDGTILPYKGDRIRHNGLLLSQAVDANQPVVGAHKVIRVLSGKEQL